MGMDEIAQVHSVDEKWQCWWGQILCGSSLWTIDLGLWQKPATASQQLLGLWNGEFHLRGN